MSKRNAKTAQRPQAQARPSNPVALALRLRGGGSRSHGDRRKAQSRNACRGRVSW